MKLGGWRAYNDYIDVRTGAPLAGNYGLYGIIDQQIWKDGDDKTITVFARVSGAPERRNVIDTYVDAGIRFAGLVEQRPQDSFGLAFSYARISADASAADQDAGLPIIRDFEALVELNYQAVVRPGRAVGDAAVIGARTVLNY